MELMVDEIIEYLWNCPSCNTKGILGRHTSCPACAASVPGNDCYYEPPPSAAVITDAAQLRDAQAGVNWRCPHCDGMERQLNGACKNCGGAKQQESYGRKDHEQVHGERDPFSVNPFDALPSHPRKRYILLGSLAGAALISSLAYGLSSYETPGEVSARSWVRSTTIQVWGQTTAWGWQNHDHLREKQHRDPVDGHGETAGMERIRGCRSEVHHYDSIPTGSHQVCVTSQTRPLLLPLAIPTAHAGSLGNGYGTRSSGGSSGGSYSPSSNSTPRTPITRCHSVTDYTQVPRYDDKCAYDTWTWADGQTKTESGEGSSIPIWPAVTLAPLERERRAAHYSVSWSYEGDEVVEREVDDEHFQAWPLHKRAILTVTRFGYVKDIR